MTTYLLEIGTEEMPAHFIGSALAQMKEIVSEALDRRRIAYESIRALGTPRRLGLLIDGLGQV